jgi:Zn-dependent peptidase ImmA (M78 family)
LPLFKALQLLNHRGIPARLVQRYTALDVSGDKDSENLEKWQVYLSISEPQTNFKLSRLKIVQAERNAKFI